MKTDEIILEANEKMEKTIENLLERFKTIRAGRANPAILDGVKVEYYGTPTPLNQLATVSVPEARRLQIKPFDKSCLANIEKAIFEADLGLTPNNTGELIFIAIPELTEDRRREFVKQAKTLAEEAKIALRNIRQDANNAIKKDEEINEIAKKHKKTPAQVVLRWNMQRNIVVLPKSTHKERIESNYDVFDFELDNDDMNMINSLNKDDKFGSDPDNFKF